VRAGWGREESDHANPAPCKEKVTYRPL
jgi:hypothetical protein